MYRVFNIALDSAIPLPELPHTSKSTPVLTIQLAEQSGFHTPAPEWLHSWRGPRGNIASSVARVAGNYLLNFPGRAEFLIQSDGKHVRCAIGPDIPEVTIRHFLLDQVIPRIVGQRGNLVLHAGCVMLPDGEGIAFLGDSGWGKSTLVTSFHGDGLAALTDDCLMVEIKEKVVVGIPNYAGARLYDDSAEHLLDQSAALFPVSHRSDKKRLIMHEGEDTSPEYVPMKAIFLLDDPSESSQPGDIVIEPISGTGEIMEFIKRIFLLDVSDKQLQARLFDRIGAVLACGVPTYHLSYPRDYALLPAVRERILGTIR